MPVIGTQNYSTWETTTVGAQNTKCLNFCMFHTCNHGQCLQHPTSCKTWCECSDGFSGAQCDIQEQTTPTSPDSIILTSDNLQSATQTATRGNIGKIFAESANFDVSQTIEKFEIFNNLEECALRCIEGVCTSNDSSIRCIPKNCPKGFACQNGICEYKDNRGFRCVCEDGWVGDFCDSKCRLNCGNNIITACQEKRIVLKGFRVCTTVILEMTGGACDASVSLAGSGICAPGSAAWSVETTEFVM
ncbi:tenascin-like [Crassostrea angulata]|uniref:tenascin-like n=1 Tax=Magallana angulata TaxID=2784310 RepID=UPI0022B13F7C|nr:tenascin-like [Crassostrea angulata]